MKRSCGCSDGNCGGEVNRREFLQTVLLGTAGVAMARAQWREAREKRSEWESGRVGAEKHSGMETWKDGKMEETEKPEAPSPKPQALSTTHYAPLTLSKPRTYQGERLEYVMMPIGGIGTGTVWLDGKGRLAVWQIFNNFTEERLSNAFFAIRVDSEGKEPLVRVLQTEPEEGLHPFESLTYEGGYPIAHLDFEDKSLPVKMSLEAFNPFIPLDTFNSSLPCAIFRWTVRNRSRTPLDVSLTATLPHAQKDPETSLLVSSPHLPLSLSPTLPPGPVKVRLKTGASVPAPPLYWLNRLDWHTEVALAQGAQEMLNKAGTLLVVNPQPEFLLAKEPPWEVFEDFERGTYEGWTVQGTAFGDAPHTGTTPGQQPVSGFLGNRLVNTYRPHDEPQGELISKPFTIRKRYIGFLIGGGDHPGETCINLRVGDKVVRTATGRNNEYLEPHAWDVSEFTGKEGVLEIIDHHSGGWGHINIDHIVFSDYPPDRLFRLMEPQQRLRRAIGLQPEQVERVDFDPAQPPRLTAQGQRILPGLSLDGWRFDSYLRWKGFQPGEDWQVLIENALGDPLLLLGRVGKSRLLLCLADRIPDDWVGTLLLAASGRPLGANEELVSGHPLWGQVVLATDLASGKVEEWENGGGGEEGRMEGWKDGRMEGKEQKTSNVKRQTSNDSTKALLAPFRLKPGESKTVSFVLTWYYPNVERFGHPGNLYARRFPDARGVARYVLDHLSSLWEQTRLYHETVYQSNLPPMIVDAVTSQSVIFRGPTCFWSEDGYFGGFEGSYGCCPLNCTHVWNYAQSHARLFPEIGRNMRESDLLVYLHPNGETSHRQHAPHHAFIDGQCATISAAYREHLTSPDHSFLDRIWKQVKKATNWLIQAIDSDEDGVPAGHQWNTYDCATSGAHTFIGSQYLGALAAAERMAILEGDSEAAQRYRRIREAGMKNQVERLWNGEYFIQIPDPQPANDYNTGCHSDQLLGQWWAYQLHLGDLYPPEKVRSALKAIMKYNFRERFAGFQQAPRRYIPDDEGGLLMCTWPRGGRPDPFIIYADEVWTGIEYAVAGLMLWMGLIEPAVKIVNTARGRYDGRRREGLNSGPGGNPFNELECGKFYARAMSSFGLLLAAQGLILDGPAGVLGFEPRWQPEDHRSFFVAAEGWGLFSQKQTKRTQTEQIQLRYGKLRLNKLLFALPEGFKPGKIQVQLNGKPIAYQHNLKGPQVELVLDKELTAQAPARLEVRFS